jgi:glycine oxidase
MPFPESLPTNETADVVIIGGGVIGLTIARALALRGIRDVLLLERGGLGAESSYAAGGMLAPRAEADQADEFFELACRSRALYPAFAAALLAETGTDVELDTTGALYLALTGEDEEEIARRCEWQTRAGLAVEKLGAAEVLRLEPRISQAVRGALRFPLDIQVENRRLLTALIAANEKLGVRLITGVNVESLRLQNGRVAGVETARGFVSSRRVVVASGAWTSLLTASESSKQLLPRVRIEPVRGQMLCFAAQPPLVRHVIYSPRGYLVPRRDGRLLAGSTSEQAGFSKQVTAGGVNAIISQALEIAPALGSLPLVDSWAGLRPRAADDLPVLGPSQIDGLIYATGHYRNGILLAPITGELIADVVVSNVVSPLLDRFSPHRFDLVDVV